MSLLAANLLMDATTSALDRHSMQAEIALDSLKRLKTVTAMHSWRIDSDTNSFICITGDAFRMCRDCHAPYDVEVQIFKNSNEDFWGCSIVSDLHEIGERNFRTPTEAAEMLDRELRHETYHGC